MFKSHFYTSNILYTKYGTLSYTIIGEDMDNRNMFYQNVNQGYSAPGGYIPPSGYNINSQYQAYGPNVIPDNYNQNYNYQSNNYEERISTLEKQIRNLDARVQKLESSGSEVTDNIYMI